jgi:L-fuculose-phosphate aldolase
MIATGPDLAKALWLAVEVETLARQYYYTLQAGGPPLLSKAEIKNVAERISSYGPRSEADADGDNANLPRPTGQRPGA